MDCVAELPADDLVAKEVQFERIVPEGQNTLLEARSEDDVSDVLLFGRTLHIVDGLHQAGMLKHTNILNMSIRTSTQGSNSEWQHT